MNKTTIWLSLSCLLVAALLLVSCTPAVFEEEEVKTEEGVIRFVIFSNVLLSHFKLF